MGFLLRRSWALPEPSGDLEDYGPDDWQIPDQSNSPLTMGQKNVIRSLGEAYVPEYGPGDFEVEVDDPMFCGFVVGLRPGGHAKLKNPITGDYFSLYWQVPGLNGQMGYQVGTRFHNGTPAQHDQVPPEIVSPDGWVMLFITRFTMPNGADRYMFGWPGRWTNDTFNQNNPIVIGDNPVLELNQHCGHASIINFVGDWNTSAHNDIPMESLAEVVSGNAYWDVITPARAAQTGGVWRRPVNARSVYVWTVDQDGTVRQVTKPLPRSTSVEFRSNGHTWFGGQRGDAPTDRNAVRAGSSQLDMAGIGRSVICRYIF